MWKNKSISVVIPAYNEEQAISYVIKDIMKLKFVDEIIIVNNNSTDNTKKIAKKLNCIVIDEPKQGYGHACITGLKTAKSDLIVLIEADNTFDPNDINRLLQYIDKYDMVLGSRIHKGMYKKNSVMTWYIRLGNYLLGKLVELLWLQKIRINDVGSTFRIIRKSTLDKIKNKFNVGGPDFAPEPTLEALKANLSIKQIPVKYLPRIGQAKLTTSWFDSLKIGIMHFVLIIKRRFSN